MSFKNLMTISVFTLIGLVAFQNCERPPAYQFTSSKALSSNDGGQQYDGKIFVLVGETCPDGSQIQARIIVSEAAAKIVRKDCQDITPIALSSTDYQINPQNATELTYGGQTFIASVNGQYGAGYGLLPKLTNPVDPTKYGAVGDGITDNTAAFVSALNVGDILIPAGNYIVKGTIRVPAGRNIQCINPSTVKIVNPIHSTTGNQTFQFWSSGGTLSNCHLVGADLRNSNGSASYDPSMAGNLLVAIVDYWGPVRNIQIVNNIFDNCHGNSCISIYGGVGGDASDSAITNNTFNNCGYFGVLISGGQNISLARNMVTDCSVGVQNDSASQPNLNNIIESNYLTVTHGTGFTFSSGIITALSGGGGPNNANYSTNIVRNNTVVGNQTDRSILITTSTAMPAQYTSNTCTNGCRQF